MLQAYQDYLLLEQALSENTRAAYLRDVERFAAWCEDEKLTWRNVKLDDIHRYTLLLYELGISSRSIARSHSSVRSFFRFLMLDGYIDADPTDLLDSPKIPAHLPEVLTLDEIDALLAAIDLSTPEGRRDHALIELLYSCGLRVSEACNLLLSDLFLDEGFLRVSGKGQKQRLVPVSPRAVKELNLWFATRAEIDIRPGEADFVFLSARRGRRLSRITVFRNVRLYAEAAGIEKTVSPHTFRHTFATHLLEGGANLRAIQAMLGHERIRTTEIYTHLDRRFLREQVLTCFPRNKPAAAPAAPAGKAADFHEK